MSATADKVWVRVGVDSEARLRWLLRFGNLAPTSLTDKQRCAVSQEVKAFVTLQEIDPAIRERMPSFPPPVDASPRVFTEAEIWRAHRWIRKGLELLSRSEKWNFAPRVTYELDAHNGMLWARFSAQTPMEKFKALAYEAFRDARFKFRICSNCKHAFVPVKRQAYCSASCSQSTRTRKWRKAHVEKNRAIRRAQYRKAAAARFRDLAKKSKA